MTEEETIAAEQAALERSIVAEFGREIVRAIRLSFSGEENADLHPVVGSYRVPEVPEFDRQGRDRGYHVYSYVLSSEEVRVGRAAAERFKQSLPAQVERSPRHRIRRSRRGASAAFGEQTGGTPEQDVAPPGHQGA